MVDSETFSLIEKYNVQGPRYTSYPTAPQWKMLPDADHVRQALGAIPDLPSHTLALYTHIPFCEEKCYYCACNVVITRHKEKAEEYLDILCREMALWHAHIPNARVTQIHWGGGTPTYLSVQQMTALFSAYQKYFQISDAAEISIEVDPRVTTREQLSVLRELGFNRISLGVQDFDARVQLAIHRDQTEEQTRTLHAWCRELGFASINMDFVYGLPYQHPQGFERTLRILLELNPDRIALYNYAHVPWMVPWQKYIPEASLPKAPQKMAFLRTAFEWFEAAGYVAIGMDHFAKADDELVRAKEERTLRRNFMGYTTQKNSLLFAFGVSAISDLKYMYIQNFRKLSDYYRAVQEGTLPFMRGHLLTHEDRVRQTVIMELMCNLCVDISSIEREFSVSFFDFFKSEIAMLEEMVGEGLLRVSREHLSVTPRGRFFMRNICVVFDAYFQAQQAASPRRYSRTL